MDLLFVNARLIDPEAGEVRSGNLAISDGKIIAATDAENGAAKSAARVIDCADQYLAPGIVDLGVKVCEPGERHKESYRSAGRAAAAGGVTTMITRPDTSPAIDTPETLEFVRRRARDASHVHVVHMAALTKGRAGREMTELGFLMDAGAAAFTDCDAVVSNPKVFARALTYAKGLGALVIAHPQEPGLSVDAVATSGPFASVRGLPAVSPLAERMALERDLALVEMTGARYHADQITTAQALAPLQRAKAAGLDVTAGVGIHHLTMRADDVADYRTFFKLKPPLRDEADRIAVVHAVRDGLIDTVCSMHTPQDEESKRLPFEEAASGAVGLETILPAALQLVHEGLIEIAPLWRALSFNPAKRLGLSTGRLAPGAPADLVLFDDAEAFLMDRSKLLSKSQNSPFDGMRLQGKVRATYVAGHCVYEA